MIKNKPFEFFPRDYTLLGITAVEVSMMSDDFKAAYGDTFKGFCSYIVNDFFWMAHHVGDREAVSRAYLQEKMDETQFDSILAEAKKLEQEYTAFINQQAAELQPKDILTFYQYYHDIIIRIYPSMDAIDFIDVLDEGRRSAFESHATDLRHIAETVYKRGEEEFIPKIASVFAREYDMTAKQALHITCHEVWDHFEKRIDLPSAEELEARGTAFLYVQTVDTPYTAYNGEESHSKARELGFVDPDDTTDITELTGRTAQGGVVEGEVCVILSKNELDKASEGCILVASMTQPSYLPAMKKAAAFVTDEGGLLCHAAIVAREMKKPCVIGTGDATRVLKDGDRVRVDADNGVVTKVS